jgi:hypothetical protein
MAASSKPYANLHFHFLFAGGCGHCKQFKETGRFDRLKDALSGTGIEIDETTALNWERGVKGGVEGKLQRQFMKHFNDWFPCLFVVRKDVYDRADNLPLDEVLKSVFMYNAEIDFAQKPPLPRNWNGKNGTKAPVYGFSVDEIKRYLNDFLKSPQHAYGDEALKFLPASSTPSSMPVVSTSSAPVSSRPYVDLSRTAPLSGGSMVRSSHQPSTTCGVGSRRILPRYS